MLPKTAVRAVRERVADPYPDARIGLVCTAHTLGRDLGFKPHVHPSALLGAGLLMTKDGLNDDAWVEIDPVPVARRRTRLSAPCSMNALIGLHTTSLDTESVSAT